MGRAADDGRANQKRTADEPQGISFALDVRPILSANCFACHGRDEESRQADLRLDVRDAAIEYGAIAPGDSAGSLLVERITSDDPDLVMPPTDSGHSLNDDQIRLLQRWIDQGAEYSEHWSFAPLQRPPLPKIRDEAWTNNAIDYFILRSLEDRNLAPAAPAIPRILIRRVFLDLIGLPPTPEVADRFAQNPSLPAYERLVDELLQSPRFGEHWARVWLDVARYADTKGYEKDLPRDMWPYRDWVVRALNQDMPFDQFTVEQLAGDLLPEPTRDQLIATAFHRNTMNNDEGGTDDEEFRVAAVKDRVDTTMQAWMGLTAGCAKCHTHKFDPISHEEYHQLFAVFNQTADADKFDDAPVLRFETPEQKHRLKQLRSKIAAFDDGKQNNKSPDGSSDRRELGSGLGQARGRGLANDDDVSEIDDNKAELDKELKEAEAQVTKLPIMRELPTHEQRTTHIHRRGNFLDPGREVEPGIPEAFVSPTEQRPRNRLELARWLVADDNPLTARVVANRVWARFFGIGIVETEGDFGSQGTPPTHPLLLDWLATELRDTHSWSLKKLCKTIVMSSTYRQSSVVEEDKLAIDPRNRLLARGARFRLPAEIVRDQALAAAGLLSQKMYGPPVMPPQPDGVWKSIYNARKWNTSEGEDRYRRAVYTYWKRTSPYPAMMIFDAESREVCSIRRIHTNTPLQALVLMNDPVYLEAAAALARRMIHEGGAEAGDRIERGFQLVLVRQPSRREVERLNQLRIASEKKFASQPDAVADFLAACSVDSYGSLAPRQFASYAVVASVILNLDEAVTRN